MSDFSILSFSKKDEKCHQIGSTVNKSWVVEKTQHPPEDGV